jgi:hypothetical protein
VKTLTLLIVEAEGAMHLMKAMTLTGEVEAMHAMKSHATPTGKPKCQWVN